MRGLRGLAVVIGPALPASAAGCGGESANGLAGCGSDEPGSAEAVYIADRTGEKWEVSHGVSE